MGASIRPRSPREGNRGIPPSIAALSHQGAAGVIEPGTVAAVVPQGAGTVKAKVARLRMHLVGVDAAHLPGLDQKRGKGQVLPLAAGVQAPAGQVDRLGTVVAELTFRTYVRIPMLP